MYNPDRVFMQRLKQLDPRLSCKYRSDIEKFVITHDRAIGPPAELFLVETTRGEFRHPNQFDINTLCEGDLHRTDVRARMDKTTRYMENYRKKEDARVESEIRDRTKDDKRQLMNTCAQTFNLGKYNSAFRRITPSPKPKPSTPIPSPTVTTQAQP